MSATYPTAYPVVGPATAAPVDRFEYRGGANPLILWHDFAVIKSLVARRGPDPAMVRNGLAGMHFNSGGTLVHELHNACRESGDLTHALWNKSQVAQTPGQADSEGGTEAVLFTSTGTNSQCIIFDNMFTENLNGVTMTVSIVAKASVGNGWCHIQMFENGGGSGAIILVFLDLNTGVLGALDTSGNWSSVTQKRTPLGNGFYRLTLQGQLNDSSAGSVRMVFGLATADNDASVDAGDAAQFERPYFHKGVDGGIYLDTSGSGNNITYDQPVFPHDPANSNVSRGLRMVGGYTQLALNTQDLQTAATNWAQGGTAFTAQSANAANGPDGTTTADSLTFPANSSELAQTITWTNVVHTISQWAKTASGTKDFVLTTEDGTTTRESANLTATTTLARLAYTTSAATLAAAGSFAIKNDSGSNAGALINWGFNVAPNPFVLPYMLGTTAAVVRPAETCITDITGLIDDEVTIEISGRTALGTDGDQVFLQLDAGDEDDRFRLFRDSSGDMHFIVTETTTEVADLDLGAVANDTDFKVIVAAKAGRFVGAVEGNSAATPDTSGDFPTGVDTQRTGHDVTGSHCQSTIATVKLFNAFDEAAVDAIAA